MKKFSTALVVSLVLVFASFSSSYGQFKLKLGPSLGLNYNIHTGSDLSQTGTGFGIVLGGQVDMDFTPTIGLITNVQFYDNRSGSTTVSGSNQYYDNYGNPVSSSVSTETSASLAYFMIEPLFKYKLPRSPIFLFAGPAIGFNVESSYDNTTSETFPAPYQSNNATTHQKGSFQNMLVRFALKVGGGYNIPVGNLDVTPQVSFGYGLTKVQSDVSWRVLTIQALVTVKFKLI